MGGVVRRFLAPEWFRRFRFVVVLLSIGAPVLAESAFSLSSTTLSPNGSISLDLLLDSTSGHEPSALQWTLTYSPSQIAAITAEAGPRASEAGKRISCLPSSGAYTCILAGLNATVMNDGAVARITVTANQGVTSLPITLIGGIGSTPSMSSIVLDVGSGAVTLAPVAISSLTCSPSSMTSGGSVNCAVSISAAAPTTGLTVSVTSNSGALFVPASVAFGAGSTAVSFAAIAGTIDVDQNALIAATLGGSSRSTSVSLIAPPALTSLSCTPTTLQTGQSASCTISLSKTAANAVSVGVANSAAAVLTAPSAISVESGLTNASFVVSAGTIVVNSTSTLSATLNGVARTTVLSLTAPAANPTTPPPPPTPPSSTSLSLSSLVCDATTLVCTVQLTQVAPAGGATISVRSASASLQVPALVQIPAGSQSTRFDAAALPSDRDERVLVTADYEGWAVTAFVDLLGVRPLALDCSNSLMKAGEWATCEIRVTESNAPSIAEVQLSSTDQDVKIPAALRTRPGQTRARFAVYVDPYAKQETGEIKATIGETAVTSNFSIAPASAPILKLPDKVNAIARTQVAFTVSAFEPTGLSWSLSANSLPTGASFNPYTGQFSWTPTEPQEGAYDITFTATNAAAASSSKRLTIRVDSGAPVITGLRNVVGLGAPADCVPGSLLSLTGRWLTTLQEAMSDPSGNGTELGGARVRVNALNVPIVYADPERISFICPDSAPGTVSNISVERGSAQSSVVQTVMADMAPGIYSIDGTGSGQGRVMFSGTSTPALLPNYQTPGRPAQSGDSITIRITGVTPADQDFDFRIGDFHVRPERIEPVAGMAGAYEAMMTLPNGITEGDAVPITLVVSSPRTGSRRVPGFRRRVQSNTVSIAVERSGN